MENTQKTRSPLETEPLSRLLLRYSVPTTLTLMVNYLYNVVDQIFVGQGVGITGMAAVNVAFPVSILVNAIALMLGGGCAANVNLCLGRKEQTTADQIFGHAVTWIVISGMTISLRPQIVCRFGSDSKILISSGKKNTTSSPFLFGTLFLSVPRTQEENAPADTTSLLIANFAKEDRAASLWFLVCLLQPRVFSSQDRNSSIMLLSSIENVTFSA